MQYATDVVQDAMLAQALLDARASVDGADIYGCVPLPCPCSPMPRRRGIPPGMVTPPG
jgi:hypothetical protein